MDIIVELHSGYYHVRTPTIHDTHVGLKKMPLSPNTPEVVTQKTFLLCKKHVGYVCVPVTVVGVLFNSFST